MDPEKKRWIIIKGYNSDDYYEEHSEEKYPQLPALAVVTVDTEENVKECVKRRNNEKNGNDVLSTSKKSS